MSKDYELVKELKNGDKKKTSFFKEKIKDELKRNGIDTNESTINESLIKL